MSVPLDRLYHFIESIAEKTHGDSVLIYRFRTHGSKKIEDLDILRHEKTWVEARTAPQIYCNDQEPLDYDYYETSPKPPHLPAELKKLFDQRCITIPWINFRCYTYSVWDSAILLHSEQRSRQIEIYQRNNFIPVYYWSHALIANDWYRFAQHIQQKKNPTHIFLIYNRAWSGTREYRLKFADLVVEHELQTKCNMRVNCVDPEYQIHYDNHRFSNANWQPKNKLENFFASNHTQSWASADFDFEDYETSEIEIVLETLFDDDRLHLTEKVLRPIACGQPFILAATQGSLQYLKNYGFKSYQDVWDETYDTIQDPQDRLQAIVDLMQEISSWNESVRHEKMLQARTIAEYNKTYFFSKDFSEKITLELENNLAKGFELLTENNRSERYCNIRAQVKNCPEILEYLNRHRSESDAETVAQQALKFNLRNT